MTATTASPPGIGLFEVNFVSGDAGDDGIVAGGTSTVVVYAFAPGSVKVDVAAGTATGWGDDTLDGEGSDRIAGVEDVIGSSFADVFTGNAGMNVFGGEGGADRLAGGPGVDRLDGGSGRDRVDSGIGRDQCLNAELRQRCP